MTFLLRFHFLILALLLGLSWFVPRFGERWFRLVEKFGARVAQKKGTVVAAAALATVLLRLALLGIMPVPVPQVHDEFSYLLAADTFAHGRLANPPHPMWIFLETFHVLQHPTYASIYPPAQGGVLALGQLLGSPWIGVLLSMAAMAAAVTWAMQAWLPPRWALLGAVLLVLRIGLISDWMNSYWGGALAATGGALVIGALPRIKKRLRVADALWMALGAALLANSRPLEGFIFCLPVGVAIVGWLLSKKGPAFAVAATRLILPAALVLAIAVAFMGLYNWRVTTNAMLFPEALDEKVYTNFPPFMWQASATPLKYNNPQFEEFYNVIPGNIYPRSLWISLTRKAHASWLFFLGSTLTIPFLAFPWILQDERTRILLIQCVWCGLGLVSVVWFYPHYAAPLTATIFILLVQMLRHLRLWTVGCRPLGVYLTRLVILLLLARIPFSIAFRRENQDSGWNVERQRVLTQLRTKADKLLVIVSYSNHHIVDHEWVYNAADIDQAHVVWARQIPGQSLEPLLQYFHDRSVWILEADTHPLRFLPRSNPVVDGNSLPSSSQAAVP